LAATKRAPPRVGRLCSRQVGRISNAWRLAQASWQVLSRDRELIAVPIIAGVAALAAFGIIAGPGVLLLGGTDESDASDFALWLILAVAAIAASWVAALGQAAVVAGAGQRMDGGDPTLATGFDAARARAGRLFGWAFLATVVALVLDVIQERLGLAGRILGSLGNLAFSVMSFLALPVIVFEDMGPIDSFKRSSQLLRTTWGEQITFSFGMGLLGFIAALPGIALGAGAIASGVLVVQVVGVALAAVWVIAVAAVVSALSAVYKTALYRWATKLPVDPAFDTADLSGAFRRR
jgi:hypothetical protein